MCERLISPWQPWRMWANSSSRGTGPCVWTWETLIFMCQSTHVIDAFSSLYGRDRLSIHSLALWPVHQPLLNHESDKTRCTVPTLTGRQGSVLSGRCVAASSDQTRRTREQEKSRASVGQTRFLSKPREIRLRAPAVFFLPRISVGHAFNAGSLARGQGCGDTLSGSQSSRPEGCVGKKPDDLFGEGDVCVVRCRAGSTPLAGAANCSEDSLQTPTGHMQDSTPTQGGSPQSRLLERADPRPSPSAPPQAEIIVATDASSSGWGGNLHALSASGRWSRGQRSRHINSLELMAVENSLRSFQDRMEGRTVCVQIDNRITVAYLAKEGGTKSVLLSRLACRILLWCQRHRVTLIPVYVRGIGNTIADALSRGKETQWHLSPTMVDRIFRRYGTHQVDLFASRETAQLPQYMTLLRGDNQALAANALSQTWDFDLPPSNACPDGGQQAQGLQGQNAANSTLLVRRSVDASPDGTPVRHASPDPHVCEAPDQHGDQLPGGQCGGPEADCMANMRSATGLNLPSATFALLENSWRPSTRRQYQAVWKE